MRRSKSPSRAAARKASTTAHWPSRSTSGTGAPRTRRRARLASCLVAVGVRPTIGATSSNGTAKTSCSTKATRSAGVRESRTTSSASPTASPNRASCSGSSPASGLTIGSGRWVSSDASRRVLRDRSMLRQTRPTTVVNQARRLSTSLVSVRLRRIQASWTASSASVIEPSIRNAMPRKWARFVSKRSASQSWSFMWRVPIVGRVMSLTRWPALV